MGKEFEMSGELAFGTPYALGKALDFAKVRRIKGNNSICLTQLGLFDNDGFRLIITRFRHFVT